MRRVLSSLLLVVALVALNCFAAERPAAELPIRQIFGLLNREPVLSPQAASALFTADADRADILNLVTVLKQMSSMRGPWQELSSPRLSGGRIDFQGASAATVEASFSHYGAGIPFGDTHFVMGVQKIGADWKISSFKPAEP